MEDIKIEILPNLYLKEDGTFDLEKALRLMVTYYENFKGNPYFAIDNYLETS